MGLGLLCASAIVCSQRTEEQARKIIIERNWNKNQAETEYELIQAELRLAKTQKPYLVLDAHHDRLLVKLKGAVVWNYSLDMAEADSAEMAKFFSRFMEGEHSYIRPITEKYLFAASEKTPDSILAIVGEAVNVSPELLQRVVPQRFQLLWDHGLILEVRTDIAGKPTSKLKNTFFEVRRALQRPFGESYIVVKMKPDEALTLYRVAQPGLPTLIYPAG